MQQPVRYFKVFANRQPSVCLPVWLTHTTSFRRAINSYARRFDLRADGYIMRDGSCYAWLLDREGHVVGGACSREVKSFADFDD